MSAGVISLPAERQKGEIRLINEPPSTALVPPILAARRYVSPRARPITPEEAETRLIAYAIKRGEETGVAAFEMAGLLPLDLPTLTLVPIPSSIGSIEANLIFARAIAAEYGPQARVVSALNRSCRWNLRAPVAAGACQDSQQPTTSSCGAAGGSPCRCSSWITWRPLGPHSPQPAMPSGLERASFSQTPHPSTSHPPNEPPKPDKRKI